MQEWLLRLSHFRERLGQDGKLFFVGMSHGTMKVELYRPVGHDPQLPHQQDELYFVIAGHGTFRKGSERRPFSPGNVIFVEAGVEHRFEDFDDTFETWVVFWGPPGGEAPPQG